MSDIGIETPEEATEREVLAERARHTLSAKDIDSYGAGFWHSMSVRWMGKYFDLEIEANRLRKQVRDLSENGHP